MGIRAVDMHEVTELIGEQLWSVQRPNPLYYGGLCFYIKTNAARRKVTFSVDASGKIYIKTNPNISLNKLKEIIVKHYDWCKKTASDILSKFDRTSHAAQLNCMYKTNDLVYIWGLPYLLDIRENSEHQGIDANMPLQVTLALVKRGTSRYHYKLKYLLNQSYIDKSLLDTLPVVVVDKKDNTTPIPTMEDVKAGRMKKSELGKGLYNYKVLMPQGMLFESKDQSVDVDLSLRRSYAYAYQETVKEMNWSMFYSNRAIFKPDLYYSQRYLSQKYGRSWDVVDGKANFMPHDGSNLYDNSFFFKGIIDEFDAYYQNQKESTVISAVSDINHHRCWSRGKDDPCQNGPEDFGTGVVKAFLSRNGVRDVPAIHCAFTEIKHDIVDLQSLIDDNKSLYDAESHSYEDYEFALLDAEGSEFDPSLALTAYMPDRVRLYNGAYDDRIQEAIHVSEEEEFLRARIKNDCRYHKCLVKPGRLMVHIKGKWTRDKVIELLDKLYKKEVEEAASNILYTYKPMFEYFVCKYCLPRADMWDDNRFWYKKVVGRKMKPLGQFTKSTKEIRLNSILARYPYHCLIGVISHELIHIIEFNHSPRFKKLLKAVCPFSDQVCDELMYIGIVEPNNF